MFRNEYTYINVNGIYVHVENAASEVAIDTVLPYLFKSESQTFQTILNLTQVGIEQGLIYIYAHDVPKILPKKAIALVEHLNNGGKIVFLPTKDHGILYRTFAHELSHATLPLANPFTFQTNYSWHQIYQDKMRRAFCTDYWDFKRSVTCSAAEKKFAKYFFHPQGYPKFEWTAERIAKGIEITAANEFFFQRISPRFSKVLGEYVTRQAKIPVVVVPKINSNFPIHQPVKLWDASIHSSNLYLSNNFSHAVQPVVAEANVMNWRPGISAARNAPWYNRVNWQGVGNLGLANLKISLPFFKVCWEYSNLLSQEQSSYPQYSKIARNLAASSSMALDYLIGERLVRIVPSWVGVPTLVIADLMGAVAYASRDIPLKAIMENEEILLVVMNNCEFSPSIQKIFLDDFRRGGTMSRNFIKNAAIITKTSLAPLAFWHEFKLEVAHVFRESGQYVSQFFTPFSSNKSNQSIKLSTSPTQANDFPIIETSHSFNQDVSEIFAKNNNGRQKTISDNFPQMPTLKNNSSTEKLEKTEASIAKVFQEINPRPNRLRPAPFPLASSATSRFFEPDTFKIYHTENNMVLEVDRNNKLLSPSLHSFLYEIGKHALSEKGFQNGIEPTKEIKTNPEIKPNVITNQKEYHYVPPKFESPLANIHIGSVQGKPGLVVDLKAGGTIGITAGLTHFLIQVTAQFGPVFFIALGQGLLVAAPIATALMLAQHFYKKHLKHVKHKINRSLKNMNKDFHFVTNNANQLFKKYESPEARKNSNYQEEINNTIHQIQDKISNERKRLRYADDHHGKGAHKQHKHAIASFKEVISQLHNLKTSLEMSKVQRDFIESHKNNSEEGLIHQSKLLITHLQTQKDWRNTINHLHKNGYNIKKTEGDSRFGGHMTAQQAIAWIESGGTVLAKKNRCDNVRVEGSEFDQDIHKIKGLRDIFITRFESKVASGKMQDVLNLIDKIPNHYTNGNTGDLNFDRFKTLIQQFIAHKEKPMSHWFSELNDATTGNKLLSTDELSLLKSAVYFHAVTNVYENALHGEFDTAQRILLESIQKLSEHNSLFTQYSNKLDELKPFLGKNAAFWLDRIKSAQTLSKDKIEPGTTFETDLAKQFILNHVLSYASHGEFDKSEIILEKLKLLSTHQFEIIQSLLSKINELKPQYENWDFCLKTLKKLEDKPKDQWQIADVLEYNTVNRSTIKNILQNVINQKFTEAKALCDALKKEFPNKATDMDAYQTAIDKVEKLKDAGNDIILDTMSGIKLELDPNSNKLIYSKEQELTITTLNAWFMSKLSASVMKGNNLEAKAHLERLKQQDHSKSSLCDSLIQSLEYHNLNSKNGLEFWKNEYDKRYNEKPPLDEDGMVTDSHFYDKNIFAKTIATKNIIDVAKEKSKLGFNREAAEIVGWINQRDNKYQEYQQDLYFTHEGQVISIFAKPLQITIARMIREMKPSSYQRTVLSFTLNTIDTAQIFVPNFPTLTSQRIYAQFQGVRSINIAQRNIIKTLDVLKQEINPWHKKFNRANCAMALAQMGLKMIPHLPIKFMVSKENLSKAETARNYVVSYGYLGTRIYTAWNAVWQLAKFGRKVTPYTPNLAMPIINAALDGSYLAIDKYQILYGKGRSEDPNTYYYRNGLGWALYVAEAVATASLLAGSTSILPLVAGLFVSGLAYKNLTSKSAEQEAIEQVLLNAIQNIHAQHKLENNLKDKNAIQKSKDNIELLLTNVFNGLTYQSEHSENINNARITHLYETVKEYFDNKDYEKVVALTQAYDQEDKKVIHHIYQIPIHLVWHIVVFFRLLSYIQSGKFKIFRDQYQEYAHDIFLSADNGSTWYQENWKNIQTGFENILSYAFQQFVGAAQNALDQKIPNEVLPYLSFLTLHYLHVNKSWHELLSDEFKLWVSYLYGQIGQEKYCKLFFNNIKNLEELIKTKKSHDEEIVSHTLELLSKDSSQHHQSLYSRLLSGSITIIDEGLYSYILRLIKKNKYQDAQQALNQSRNFIGKEMALAQYRFYSSNFTDILGTLTHLLKVNNENKNLNYWDFFKIVIRKALESIKYAPDPLLAFKSRATLWGFIKICADQIQKFDISEELKHKTEEEINCAMNIIKAFVAKKHFPSSISDEALQAEVKSLLEYGHKCIRGDEDIDLIVEIKNLLGNISYQFIEEGQLNKFIPAEVLADGDCAFHVLGVTRADGMKKLLNHIEFLKTEYMFKSARYIVDSKSNVVNDVIFNILLDDLEYQNKSKYNRHSANFEKNMALVQNYLHNLSKPHTWMPCNPGSRSILDALAFLLEKNLSIYLADHDDKLVLLSSSIHKPTYKTIHMLFTNANGISYKQLECNHYVKLISLPCPVVELIEEKKINVLSTSNLGMFKPVNSTSVNSNLSMHPTLKEKSNESKLNQQNISVFNNAKGSLEALFKEALIHNDLTSVQTYLDSGGISLEKPLHYYGTSYLPLSLAAKLGHEDIVKLMLSYGAGVNHALEDRKTALMFASEMGHTEIVQILLSHGKNVNTTVRIKKDIFPEVNSDYGCKPETVSIARDNATALIFAVKNGHFEVVKLLLEAGADPNFITKEGKSALNCLPYRSVNKDDCRIIEILISYGAYLSEIHYENYTIFYDQDELREVTLKFSHLVHLTNLLKNYPNASQKDQVLHILKWYLHRLPIFSFFNTARDNLLCNVIQEISNLKEEGNLSESISQLIKYDKSLLQFINRFILSESKPPVWQLFIFKNNERLTQSKKRSSPKFTAGSERVFKSLVQNRHNVMRNFSGDDSLQIRKFNNMFN